MKKLIVLIALFSSVSSYGLTYDSGGGAGGADQGDVLSGSNASALVYTNSSKSLTTDTTLTYNGTTLTIPNIKITTVTTTANSVVFSTNVTTTGLSTFPDGTAALPAITFNSAGTNDGIYMITNGQIGFSSGGSLIAAVASTGIYSIAGSAATPSVSYLSDTDNGMFFGTNQTSLASGGVEEMRVVPAGVAISTFNIGTPLAPLHVFGGNDGIAEQITINATQANVTAADTFISFNSTSGQEASVAGTAGAGVIAFNTFTGSHYTIVEGKEPDVYSPLEATGEPIGAVAGMAPKGQLVKSRTCHTKASKSVIGFFGGSEKKGGKSFALALGTGFAWIANKGLDVEVGDLLMTSDVSGSVEIQTSAGQENLNEKDGIVRQITVAKARQPIIWKKNEKKRKIAVVYTCG